MHVPNEHLWSSTGTSPECTRVRTYVNSFSCDVGKALPRLRATRISFADWCGNCKSRHHGTTCVSMGLARQFKRSNSPSGAAIAKVAIVSNKMSVKTPRLHLQALERSRAACAQTRSPRGRTSHMGSGSPQAPSNSARRLPKTPNRN